LGRNSPYGGEKKRDRALETKPAKKKASSRGGFSPGKRGTIFFPEGSGFQRNRRRRGNRKEREADSNDLALSRGEEKKKKKKRNSI